MATKNGNKKPLFPYTYGDNLEYGNGFTSETVITKISEYCSNEKTQENFYRGYKFGLLIFGIGSLLVSSTPAFAEDKSSLIPGTSNSGGATNNAAGSCPGTKSSLIPGNSNIIPGNSNSGVATNNAAGSCPGIPGNSNSGGATNNAAGSCPGTGPGPSGPPASTPVPRTPGSLANIPTTDRGAFSASALGICAVAMKSGAYWVGFICAAAVIVGVRMASIPPKD